MIERKKTNRQIAKENEILKNLANEMDNITKQKIISKIALGKELNISPELLSAYGKTKMPSLVTFALLCEDLNVDANDILGIKLDKDLPDNKKNPE